MGIIRACARAPEWSRGPLLATQSQVLKPFRNGVEVSAMKPIALTLHPLSALAGAGLLGLGLLTTGSLHAASKATAVACRCAQLRPDPRAILVIREGTPYAVPEGRRFVVTGLGSTNPTVASVVLLVDGLPEMTTHTETSTTIRETPSWFSVSPGAVISAQGGDVGDPGDGRIFGYLMTE